MTGKPRAMVFAPYLGTLGGGERVIVEVARILSGHFDLQLSSPQVPDEARWTRLGFPDLDVEHLDARQFMRRSRSADVAVVMANHIPLPSLARRSFLIVQFPGGGPERAGLLESVRRRVALNRYTVLTYSQFNQSHIRERWAVDSVLLPPPVTQYGFEPALKGPSILSVGRLHTSGGHKRHDVLLDAWSLVRPLLPDWNLVLAGAGRPDDPVVRVLSERAAEIGNARVVADASPVELAGLYATASIYWHAAGYGRPADRPDQAEHFGMATLEAMSAGAIPLAFCDGGQVELLSGTDGVLWATIDELIDATVQLAGDEARTAAAARVHHFAQGYDRDTFAVRLLSLVGHGT